MPPLQSTTFTEPNHLNDVLKWAASEDYASEEVTLLAGSGAERVLVTGTVLGTVTASGKYVPLDQDASDGSEVAAAVLKENVTVPDGTDLVAEVLVRGPCLLASSELVWPSDIDAGEQATAEAELVALGLVLR